MELTFKDLKKRDVINVADGKCLGHITNLKLSFPSGTLTGIFVPGRRNNGIFRIFDRSETFIPQKNIIKIGGDVILVDCKFGSSCEPIVNVNDCKSIANDCKSGGKNKNSCSPICSPFPPQCPPNCSPVCPPSHSPNCPPPCPPKFSQNCTQNTDNCDNIFDNFNENNFFDL